MSDHVPDLGRPAENGFHPVDADRFDASWDRLESAYLERMAAALAPFTAWRDRLHAGATETARWVEAHPAEARFLTVDSLAAGEAGRRRQAALATRLAIALDSAREELADPDSVPEGTSSWIVALFFNRIYRRCVAPAGPDLPSQLPELLFLAISAYFGTEAGLEELMPPP